MKFLRFKHNNEIGFGVLSDDKVRVYTGDMFNDPQMTNHYFDLNEIEWLLPCVPGNFIGLWNNSRVQIERLGREIPKEVLYFLKPTGSLITAGENIIYPQGQSSKVALEGELGVVIGKKCKNVAVSNVKDYIFGYTVVNDITAQDVVKRDPSYPQYVRAKGYDTFGVFGPVIETEVDPLELQVKSYINGKLCQDFPISDLVFNPYNAVADISKTMTLYPGDVIACGTSLGVELIRVGDAIEINVHGIGSLRNRVV